MGLSKGRIPIYAQPPHDGVELLEMYNKGGLHPTNLSDILDGRIEVIHKLGDGRYSTVWLCFKLDKNKWKARLCLVFGAFGPNVSKKRETNPKRAKKIYQRAVSTVKGLYGNNICHGDFRPGNIVCKLRDLDELGKEVILGVIGTPNKIKIQALSGQEPVQETPHESLKHQLVMWHNAYIKPHTSRQKVEVCTIPKVQEYAREVDFHARSASSSVAVVQTLSMIWAVDLVLIMTTEYEQPVVCIIDPHLASETRPNS
ncbi:putative Protein kinase domain-containing protein [Seiridium unicorne]|uniref:Non-specific serine/threonine protein kinase n=1 Tax=Seiridium unicorne TaxID=138068 RepID=A0ABR2UDV4_9PEZI